MNIAQKFLLTILATSLLPLLGVGLTNLITTQKSLHDQIQSRIDNTAKHHLDRLNTVNARVSTQLNNVKYKAQVRLLFDEYNTKPTVATQTKLNQALQDILKQEPTFHSMHILNFTGEIISSTDPTAIGKDYSKTEVFKTGSIDSTTSIFFKNSENELDQYIATPLDLDGQKLGMIIVEATAAPYLLITKDYSELGNTGESYLTSKSSDGKNSYLTPLRFNPNAPLTTVNTTNINTDYRNHHVIASSKPVPSTNWTLVTKIDIDEVYAPVIQMRSLLSFILLITAVIAILCGWYISRLMTAPVKRLTEVVTRIGAGDLAQRIHVESKDEIGTLASTFNSMTAKLQESYQDLEQKVKDRTQTLNEKVQELGDAKAKDDAILNSVGDGMIVTGTSGTILLANTIAADLLGLGFDNKQLIGQSITLCKFYDDTGAELAFESTPSQIAIQTGQKVIKEVKLTRKDGSSNSLSINAMPIFQIGKITGVIQLIRDITKEKEVDRMKTEFISLASHQLKTPLSAIRWFTEMLITGDAGQLNKQQAEFALSVSDSTERMIDLVNSLLNISRIESGRIIVEPQPTDVSKLVGGIVNDLKAKIDEKKQNLVVSIHKDLPMINLDPHLIGQVYLNLLTNAIKYTPEGGDVTVFISKKENEFVSQISDSGYGIPLAQQKRVFQKFFRADNVAKVITDGTGLGLYLVKAIIESSGGKITFQSQEGKGTTFWFSLPITGMVAKKGEVSLS